MYESITNQSPLPCLLFLAKSKGGSYSINFKEDAFKKVNAGDTLA